MIAMWHPGIEQGCQAVSDEQADHLETLGWQRADPPADDSPDELFRKTAAGMVPVGDPTPTPVDPPTDDAPVEADDVEAPAPPATPKPSTPRKPKD